MSRGRELLNRYLEDHELSQSELARRCGVHHTVINKLCGKDDRVPDLETAVAIENATNGVVPHTSWIALASEVPRHHDESIPRHPTAGESAA